MNKEDLIFRKHMIDLSRKASLRGFSTFSDFLTLNQLHIVHSTPKEMFFAPYETFGGVRYAERQMVRFLPDALSLRNEVEDMKDWPISALQIVPAKNDFQTLPGHRDYLGAILNLGIDRSIVGDILLADSFAVLLVNSSFVSFIQEELKKVRHCKVDIKEIEMEDFSYEPKFISKTGTVASVRLDSLLSVAFSLSRSKLIGLIQGGKVFVNGRLIVSNSFHPQPQDIISVRGMGRFIYNGVEATSKKGRQFIKISLYDTN